MYFFYQYKISVEKYCSGNADNYIFYEIIRRKKIALQLLKLLRIIY